MRLWVAIVAALLASCAPSAAHAPHDDQWLNIEVDARPVRVHDERIGVLRARGVLDLTSTEANFGGLSGLEVLEDNRFIAVSDDGDWFDGRIVLDDDGALIGLADVRIASLRNEHGLLMESKQEWDAEDIAQLQDGRFALSFEQTQNIRIYDLNRDGPFGAARMGPALLGVAGLPLNAGLEAMTTTPDGALLIGAEGGDESSTPLWLARLDAPEPAPEIARYPLERGYGLTSMDRLPNGDIVALERFYAPVVGARGRIVRFSAAELKITPDHVVETQELALLAPPFPVDNFEAISAVRSPDGGVRLYVLTDNNFNRRQRTLLLAFDLVEPR
jgi:hypothetical protein